MHLELTGKCKEVYLKVGESQVGNLCDWIYRIVNHGLLWGSLASEGSEKRITLAFQQLTQMHKDNERALLKAQITFY